MSGHQGRKLASNQFHVVRFNADKVHLPCHYAYNISLRTNVDDRTDIGLQHEKKSFFKTTSESTCNNYFVEHFYSSRPWEVRSFGAHEDGRDRNILHR